MNKDELSLETFRDEIPKQRVLILKIITIALTLGPVIFSVIAMIIDIKSENPPKILMTVNFVLAFLMLVMSNVIPGLILRSSSQMKPLNTVNILNKIQGAHMVKFALAEGAALFGGVCVLLGLGAINLVSLIPLSLALATSFPSEKMICKQFIIYFKQDSRLLIELEQ